MLRRMGIHPAKTYEAMGDHHDGSSSLPPPTAIKSTPVLIETVASSAATTSKTTARSSSSVRASVTLPSELLSIICGYLLEANQLATLGSLARTNRSTRDIAFARMATLKRHTDLSNLLDVYDALHPLPSASRRRSGRHTPAITDAQSRMDRFNRIVILSIRHLPSLENLQRMQRIQTEAGASLPLLPNVLTLALAPVLVHRICGDLNNETTRDGKERLRLLSALGIIAQPTRLYLNISGIQPIRCASRKQHSTRHTCDCLNSLVERIMRGWPNLRREVNIRLNVIHFTRHIFKTTSTGPLLRVIISDRSAGDHQELIKAIGTYLCDRMSRVSEHKGGRMKIVLEEKVGVEVERIDAASKEEMRRLCEEAGVSLEGMRAKQLLQSIALVGSDDGTN